MALMQHQPTKHLLQLLAVESAKFIVLAIDADCLLLWKVSKNYTSPKSTIALGKLSGNKFLIFLFPTVILVSVLIKVFLLNLVKIYFWLVIGTSLTCWLWMYLTKVDQKKRVFRAAVKDLSQYKFFCMVDPGAQWAVQILDEVTRFSNRWITLKKLINIYSLFLKLLFLIANSCQKYEPRHFFYHASWK